MTRCYDTCCRPEQDVDVSYAVLSRRDVHATRKPHACTSCGGQVAVGSRARALAVLALDEGRVFTDYSHVPGDPACTGDVLDA